MNNIIVYVDDAAHALQMLQPLGSAHGGLGPIRWILLGCAPRVTHRASKWVTNSARESWRGKWAEKTFSMLLPALQNNGDVVVTQLAQTTLSAQTETLIKEYGQARVLDARRPKPVQEQFVPTPSYITPNAGILGYIGALVLTGLMIGTD